MKIIYDTEKEELVFDEAINVKYPEKYTMLDFNLNCCDNLSGFSLKVFSLVDEIRTMCKDRCSYFKIRHKFRDLVDIIIDIENYIKIDNEEKRKIFNKNFYKLNRKINLFYYFIDILKKDDIDGKIYSFMMDNIEEIYYIVDDILEI